MMPLKKEVYFISAANSCIKIGISNNPQKRLRELQVGSHMPLELIGTIPGTIEDEKKLHEEFKNSHLQGEWYRPDNYLLEKIHEMIAEHWDVDYI